MTIYVKECRADELAIDWQTLKWLDDHIKNNIPFEDFDKDGDTVESFSYELNDGYSWLIRIRNYEEGPYLDVQFMFNGSSLAGVKEYKQYLSNNTFSHFRDEKLTILMIKDLSII
jgi:hypothetical protein